MNNRPFFSIVIPTLNEEDYLPLLLSDLEKQTYDNFEIIHVDCYSNDNTVEEAKKFKKKLTMKFLQSKIKNVSHQRNIGISETRGEWLLFMDADNRIPKYFLDGIRYRLALKPKTDIFTTWVDVSGDKKVNEYITKIINFSFELYKTLGKESALGSMIGVKKHIAQKYPFDAQQKVMEDSVFVKTIVDKGYHFNIFKDPKYTFSLRRLEARGLLKNIQTSSQMVFNYYVMGNDFKKNNFGYEMNGGKSYKKTDGAIFNMLIELENSIRTQPAKKLEQTKRLFKSIMESL